MGRVEDGTTVCDFDPEEQRRGISLSLAVAPFEWKGHKINLIDTPGYADFVGDVAAALRVADLAVFVGQRGRGRRGADRGGVAGRRRARRPPHGLRQQARPRAGVVRAHARPAARRFGAGVAPLELPIGEEAGFRGVVDLLTDTAFIYDGGGADTTATIPDEMEALRARGPRQPGRGDRRRRRRADGALPRRRDARRVDELERTLADGIATATVFPVLCGSADDRHRHRPPGRLHLRDRALAPRPAAGRRRRRRHRRSRSRPTPRASRWPRVQDHRRPVRRPDLLFKVLSGHGPHRRPPRQHPHRRRRAAARPVHAAGQGAGHRSPRSCAGDIAAVAKLADTTTGDMLAPKGTPVDGAADRRRPEPCWPSRSWPAHQGRRGQARQRAAPPAGRGPGAASSSATTRPTRRCCGAWARPTCRSRSRSSTRKFGVERRHRGRAGAVPRDDHRRRPRPRASSRSRAAATASSAWRGCGSSRSSAAPASSSSTRSSAARSPASSSPPSRRASRRPWPTAACTASRSSTCGSTCFDGKYHPVDSSEMAFKTAGVARVPRGAGQGRPGPARAGLASSWSPCPADYQGDIMGDLNARRGRVQGTEAGGGGEQEIIAHVPTSEILRYAIDLRSMTGGRGRFTDQPRPLRPGAAPPRPNGDGRRRVRRSRGG